MSNNKSSFKSDYKGIEMYLPKRTRLTITADNRTILAVWSDGKGNLKFEIGEKVSDDE